LVFESPSQLRFRPVSDGVSSIFPLIRRPYLDNKAAASFCPDFRQFPKPRVVELCLALSVQHLELRIDFRTARPTCRVLALRRIESHRPRQQSLIDVLRPGKLKGLMIDEYDRAILWGA
jgi:hypothetical protein